MIDLWPAQRWTRIGLAAPPEHTKNPYHCQSGYLELTVNGLVFRYIRSQFSLDGKASIFDLISWFVVLPDGNFSLSKC